MKKTAVIVLAGGFGKRMQSDLPKVLHTLHNRPLVSYVLDAVKASGVCDEVVVVVGYKKELVKETLGAEYKYVVQEEQLGTGHAVMCTEDALRGRADEILVLYGDMPYVSAGTIRALVESQQKSNGAFSMATVTVPDFNEWREAFYGYGRIIRDKEGNILKTVEKKDASEEELKIKELNPCYYCFNAEWLWKHLHSLENNNAQKEYYLTDLVSVATGEGQKIPLISIEPKEALGINTREHLERLHRL